MPVKDTIINDCPKGATSCENIRNLFDAGDICMKCNNILYINGEITCKYGEKEENNETN